ncbi:tripartite tricarboxylate transporter permease [Desulfotomaculum sp. 1211_IL3151]|uniref:tripartite tricarboxylate transporter permease n=1 Tax=Desulfotomaculum sp. 1211_IL3151 TaxID=3084055 RepID=UPI002FDB3634
MDLNMIVWAFGAAALGGIIFTFMGLISGTDETATIAPFTLLIILLGFPPVAIFSFFMAAVVSKHMTHAIPTALMGVPGDTMAVPLLDDSNALRRLGVPHIALRKMISGAILGAVIALPISVGFATLLVPFGDVAKAWAGPIFVVAAIIIAYTSKGKWASILALLPFAVFMQGMIKMAAAGNQKISICIFLGIAIGPMFADLVTYLSPKTRNNLLVKGPREFWLAPEMKGWKGWFPNPLKILTPRQVKYTSIASFISGLTFTFSPVGMTVMAGEAVKTRTAGFYQKHTGSLAVMNATTEATYIGETLIPLVAFGLPLSPMAVGPAAPLYNAPPVFTVEPLHNLHHVMSTGQFFLCGLLGVIVASIIAYPFAMNYARRASMMVLKYVSQEAIISMFVGLITVIAYYEAGAIGIAIAGTIAVFGGILNKYFGIHTGVQFMTFYASAWGIKALFGF